MTKSVCTLLSVTFLTGCTVPTYEEVEPMGLGNDMAQQSVADTTCSRGNSPFDLTVAADGTAVGQVLLPKPEKIRRGVPPPKGPQFTASLKATDKRTVLLEIPAGQVSDEAISEEMTAIIREGKVLLRGSSFECFGTQVRSPGR